MTISLYDITVGQYLQTAGAAEAFLARGLAHCGDNGIDPETLLAARLAPDMLPLAFQCASIAHHSIGAIEGTKAGASGPPQGAPATYAEAQALITDTIAKLKALTPDEVNGLAGKDVTFAIGSFKLPFVAEGFLMSFSLPNFYFHATTAYDILRANGVPLGKRDFMGALKLKG
ncbi:MAG TPA: DUF1993 domain-containing protein [Caulobacter sp.]|nr:DUF1993 domain-containing protein [Caulobacter sp.]